MPKPKDPAAISIKWVYRNKLDEDGNVVRNTARLVGQGYSQEERIDYDETYAPVARLEAIRMLLAYVCFMGFKLFQMDVKSAFLNGVLTEEVYVKQPPGFEDPHHPEYVYKLNRALYGSKLLELGLNVLASFFLQMATLWERQTRPYSLNIK